jgi:D-aminopeptidase
MMVVATDAPLNPTSLERLAKRAMMGIARTGSYASNGSGDYVIAFSTHPDVRQPRESLAAVVGPRLVNAAMSPLFLATVEATEEAVINALLKATTVTSRRGVREAIDIEAVRRVLARHNSTNWDETLPPRGAR